MEEQESIRQTVRKFVQDEIEPIRREYDTPGDIRFP